MSGLARDRAAQCAPRRSLPIRGIVACSLVVALVATTLATIGLIGETVLAQVRGPEYSGPTTTQQSPAYFGPAPNPFPYCESPTYFDPFQENISPIGEMDLGDQVSVTTGGITMDLTITGEGNPGTQYPGFFPTADQGRPNDRAKGIELAEGDRAEVGLSEPLFYSQWIFTDVDQPNEGFRVTPSWTETGEAAVFGGDNSFDFTGTTNQAVVLDDTNGVASSSQAIEGRVQVDFLGAVTGITMQRTQPSDGQSGFAVGGGCEAAGAAKVVTSGPTWNGTGFDVTFALRMRNNLPSAATIQSVLNDAIRAEGSSALTATPEGILLQDLQLTDDLRDDAFAAIEVTSISATDGIVVNPTFDGLSDFDLVQSGAITAETEEIITLEVSYTPDLSSGNWDDCSAGFTYENQTVLTANAANVGVSDLSDDGISAAPNDDNGAGGVDDPTLVTFPCPRGGLEIVKTALAGSVAADCPDFADGIVGDGPAVELIDGDTVTYCISVRNPGPGPISDVVINDPQGLGQFSIGTMEPDTERGVSFEIAVDMSTPTTNTATVTATDSLGDLGPVRDTAIISIAPKPDPLLEIRKTVVPGPDGECPTFTTATAGIGEPLAVQEGAAVTYCLAVRNIGDGDASNVLVTDPQAPREYTIGDLAAGDAVRRSYDLLITADTPPVNTATANYDGPNGPQEPVDDDAQIDITLLRASLEIVKTVVQGPDGECPASFDEGVMGEGAALALLFDDTATYCVAVRNSGDGAATNVTVTDAQAPGPIDLDILNAAETKFVAYDVVVTATTPTRNTATATGVGPQGQTLPLVQDDAIITTSARPEANLQIVKTVLPGADAVCPTTFEDGVLGDGPALGVSLGDTVTYCLVVRNSGLAPATDVEVADPMAPELIQLGTVAAETDVVAQYNVVVAASTALVNTAAVSGVGPNGQLPIDTDTAVIARLSPDLQIVKTVVSGPNGDCPGSFEEGVQGPGEALGVSQGDSVTYCLAVRNTGEGVAIDVTITDPQSPASPYVVGVLPASAVHFEQYDVLVASDTPLVNTATVTGVGPDGPVDDEDDAEIVHMLPELEIVKTVLAGPNAECPTAFDDGVLGAGNALQVELGDVVTYCVVVRNSGAGIVTDVAITDDQAPNSPYEVGTLVSDAEHFEQYDLTVTASTALVNTAVVTGEGPDGTVQDDDDAVIDRIDTRIAAIALIHSVSKATDDCVTASKTLNSVVADRTGVPITWCAKVTNTGDVALANVIVTAPELSGDPIDVLARAEMTVLGRGESIGLLVAGEIPEGGVLSDASVIGDPADAEGNLLLGIASPTDDDDAVVIEASINIETTVVAGADGDCTLATELVVVPQGLPITWCFAVTNTGASHLLVTQVTDPDLGIVVPVPSSDEVLSPDATIFLQTNDVADSAKEIDADVRGTPVDSSGQPIEDAPEVTDNDPAAIDTPFADLAISKTNSGEGPMLVGDELTYTLTVANDGPHAAQVVTVTDTLPVGLEYVALPGVDGWVCAVSADQRGFTCLRSADLAVGVTETLTYTVRANADAVAGEALVNLAVLASDTPDPDDTNNTDDSTTETREPDEVLPRVVPPQVIPPQVIPPLSELPEDPGPFSPPAPPLSVDEPTPPAPPLAVTGAASNLYTLLAAAMLAFGGVMNVGARRSRNDTRFRR